MWKKFWQKHKENRRAIRDYYRDDQELTISNLKELCMVSSITTALIVFLVIIAAIVVERWSLTFHYGVFMVVMFFYAVVSTLVKKKGKYTRKCVEWLVLSFKICLIAFMIVIDIFPNPNVACTFTPMFLAVSPALFIWPYWLEVLYLGGSGAIFLALTIYYKEGAVAESDIFTAIVGLFFGLILSVLITKIRVNDYGIRVHYQNKSQIDGLTGIYNKSACEEEMREYLTNQEKGESCVFMIIDLDDFKKVNDTLGHGAGDQLLESVGKTLKSLFRANDIVGRFGGDEFIVFLKNIKQDIEIEQKCNQIQEALLNILREDSPVRVSCSIGVVKTMGKKMSYEELFKMADGALYEAKKMGKNTFVLKCPKSQLKKS